MNYEYYGSGSTPINVNPLPRNIEAGDLYFEKLVFIRPGNYQAKSG